MGGGKCQLCMKESAAIERTWRRTERWVIRRAGTRVIHDEATVKKKERKRKKKKERDSGEPPAINCVCLLKKSQVT